MSLSRLSRVDKIKYQIGLEKYNLTRNELEEIIKFAEDVILERWKSKEK